MGLRISNGFFKVSDGVFRSIEPIISAAGGSAFLVTELFTTTGAGTWTKPPGVTSVTIECWGGGGGGGGTTANDGGGGGGGGGAYAKKTITYSEAISNLSYTIGAGGTTGTGNGGNGGNTFWETNVVLAEGGFGGTGALDAQGTPGGSGGADFNSIGDIKYSGGAGNNGFGNLIVDASGGGGGGAGSTGNGGDAVNNLPNGGIGTSQFGGNGGNGTDGTVNFTGLAGSNYGGGGSGAFKISGPNRSGGAGAQGLIRVSYEIDIVTSNLQLFLDAGINSSYSGTGTIWNDISGNNRSGSLFNAPIYTSGYSGSFTFDGTSEFAAFNYSGSLTGSYTYLAWVRTPTLGGKSFIARGRDFSGAGWSINLGVDGSTIPGFSVVTTTPSITSVTCADTVAINTNTWYFLAGSWSAGSQLKLYVDGSLKNTTPYTGTNLRTSTDGVVAASLATNAFFNVVIGSFQIYDRVLTDSEVLQNYNSTKTKYGY